MNRTTVTTEVAAAAAFQLVLAALLRHATERASIREGTAAGAGQAHLPQQGLGR